MLHYTCRGNLLLRVQIGGLTSDLESATGETSGLVGVACRGVVIDLLGFHAVAADGRSLLPPLTLTTAVATARSAYRRRRVGLGAGPGRHGRLGSERRRSSSVHARIDRSDREIAIIGADFMEESVEQCSFSRGYLFRTREGNGRSI
jgi:hypothetical protein